jgi:thiamine biosynthesis lipoprotein
MGMPVSIHVRAEDPDRPDVRDAVAAVHAHLRKVDAVFSTWRADSDVMRLQRREMSIGDAHAWVPDVVDLAVEAEERTAGLFNAWWPRPGGRRVFDPTGLVKGWAVARSAGHLENLPEVAFCVNAGGDVVAGTGRGMWGRRPEWRIGIEDPADSTRIADVVTLTRGGLATSGAAARGAHVVDPRTGKHLDRSGSATVHGPDLMWADIWATASFVDPGAARDLMARRDPAYTLITL